MFAAKVYRVMKNAHTAACRFTHLKTCIRNLSFYVTAILLTDLNPRLTTALLYYLTTAILYHLA